MPLYRIPKADTTADEGSEAAPLHDHRPHRAHCRNAPTAGRTATAADMPALTAVWEATEWTTTSSALNNVRRIRQDFIDHSGGSPHTKERIADTEAILAPCRGNGITVTPTGEFETDSTTP